MTGLVGHTREKNVMLESKLVGAKFTECVS